MKKLIITKLIITVLVILVIGITSCTDNGRARNFGGTEEISLRKNEKFINITWKKDNLWIIVEDTVTGKFYAREKSSFGALEGTIVINKFIK